MSQYMGIPKPLNKHTLVRQGVGYLINAGFLFSGVLLTSATVERYISVRFPLKVKSWNLHIKTKILLVVYFIAAFGLGSYTFLCYDIISLDIDTCLPKFDHFCYATEIIVVTVFSNGICTLLMFIFTILTSIELFKLKRKITKMGKEYTKEFGITVMLVTVATLFLILPIPETILLQLTNYLMTNNMASPVLDTNTSTIYDTCDSQSCPQFYRLLDIL